MVARTICSRRTGATPTFGLTNRSSCFFGWPINYHRDGRGRQAGRGWEFSGGAAAAGGGRADSRAPASLGRALRLQALERNLRVVGKRHRGGERVVAGALGDEPVHRLTDATVGRMALGRRP